MQNFMTVTQAKQKIHELNRYVYLAETFEIKNTSDRIIKQYAYLGSLQKVTDEMNSLGYEIEVDDVRNTIKQRGTSELHKILRTGFMKKARSARIK